MGYRRFKGRNCTPEEVDELYQGLKDAGLDHFDVMLSGYCPSAELVEQVGYIGRELKTGGRLNPGSFFWILDPVMGDNGRIYVAEETVPAYKSLLRDADLILPNQFEAELLSDTKIHDLATMRQAIATLHKAYQVPHVLITSIRLPAAQASTPKAEEEHPASMAKLSIVGSSATSDKQPRLFRITVPALPVFFSGTGDMFSAILVARLRQAAKEANVLNQESWQSPDDVSAHDLPLAKAAERVLASMHSILKDTEQHHNDVAQKLSEEKHNKLHVGSGKDASEQDDIEKHLRLTRAAEVRVVRNAKALREPPNLGDFKAQAVDIQDRGDDSYVNTVTNDLGVMKVAGGEGAVHQT